MLVIIALDLVSRTEDWVTGRTDGLMGGLMGGQIDDEKC